MPDGSRRDGAAGRVRDAGDSDALYMLFLGRVAESEEARANTYGKPVFDVAEAAIASAEFRYRLLERFLENGSLPHDLLTAAELKKVAALAAEAGLAAFAPLHFASPADYALDLAHLDGAAFIRAAYRALLARDPDPAGERHYLARLDDSAIAKRRIITEIMGSAEFRQRGRRWRMVCPPRSNDAESSPDDGAVLPFGWRSVLHRLFASGPAARMLEHHHGALAPQLVAALRPVPPDLMLHIGAPGWLGGPEPVPVRDRLWIDGWALARHGVVSVEIAAGEQRLGAACCGLPRGDVAAAFPDWPEAARSGFAATIPARALPPEVRTVRVVLRDNTGTTATAELLIERIAECDREPVYSAPGQARIANRIPLPLCRQADQDLSRDAGNEAAQAMQECRADCDEMLRLHIDEPEITHASAELPIRSRLFIEGWALARGGIDSIDAEVDGRAVSSAHYGLPRGDIAAGFPDWDNAQNSGFRITLSGRSLPHGRHAIRIVLRDNGGNTKAVEFRVRVAEDSEVGDLRQKISQAEIDLHDRILSSLDWHPRFCFLMAVGYGGDERARARATLASLREQAYSDWHVRIALGRHGLTIDRLRDRLVDGSEDVRTLRARLQDASDSLETWRDSVLDGFDDISDRVAILPQREMPSLAELAGRVGGPVLFGLLAAGDELSVDALLEFAVTGGLHRDADFLYSDELRVSPLSKAVEPFLKPQWSPDLLLSTNYIGRLWCAAAELIERTGATLEEVFRLGEYDLVLRASEAARTIRHIPALLCRRGAERLDSEAMERRALERALGRRGIAGEVLAGCISGSYRIRRRLVAHGLVSIIIPTCASRGLIRTCLETLRHITAYRNFEIICIDNIPADKPEWKRWLRANADKVIDMAEPFNWSRFNNRAAEKAAGEFLLFLNDDVEIVEPDWLDALIEHGQRHEVGVVGAQLLYPNRTVQHAGMFLTSEIGHAVHAFRNLAEYDPGYFGLALTQRNVIAVTGACLLTRTETFHRLGGFDEAHNVVNNDLDYCLKAWRQGLLIVFTPHAKLIHHECGTRNADSYDYDARAFHRQWRDAFVDGDPYHHRHLSRDSDILVPEREPLRLICAGRPLLKREAVRRILVMKLDHIGDCLTAFPAIRRLKQYFPHATLRVLASRWTRPIWTYADTVDEVIEFDFFHTRAELGLRDVTAEELQSLHSRLAPYRFDLAVDLRKHPETRPVLQYTGARYLAGLDQAGRYSWLDIALEWRSDVARGARKRQTVGDDLVNLVDAIAASCEPERVTIPRPHTGPLSLPAVTQHRLFARPFVCVHPAAGEKMRQWLPDYFAELIDLLIEREQVNIALIGGRDDQEIAAQVLRSVRHRRAVVDLVGETRLEDVPKLMLRCALFIGNNSGPHHLAAGLGVPTIGIHSAVVDAREWGPVGPHAIALRREMDCGPCYLARPEHCHRGLACIVGLRPGDVYAACRRLLALGAGKPAMSHSDARLAAK